MRRGFDAVARFGKTHDMRSKAPVPSDTIVRVRTAGLNQTFIGRADEFNWIAPECINPLMPWMVDTTPKGAPADCYFAGNTVAEYVVVEEDLWPMPSVHTRTEPLQISRCVGV